MLILERVRVPWRSLRRPVPARACACSRGGVQPDQQLTQLPRPGTFRTLDAMESRFVAPRRVDIWVPGGLLAELALLD
jgi:hypothetical protein